MKALLRFLLHTGVGREIVRAIVNLAIRLFQKKVLDKVDGYKKENIEQLFKIAHDEMHADLEAGKVTVKDLI